MWLALAKDLCVEVMDVTIEELQEPLGGGPLFFYLSRENKVKMLVTQSCPLCVIPQAVAHQAPLSMEFSRQEYWNGLPFSSPGDLPHPGIEPKSPTFAGRFFTIWAMREALMRIIYLKSGLFWKIVQPGFWNKEDTEGRVKAAFRSCTKNVIWLRLEACCSKTVRHWRCLLPQYNSIVNLTDTQSDLGKIS